MCFRSIPVPVCVPIGDKLIKIKEGRSTRILSTQSAKRARSVSTRVSPYRIILQSYSVNASCQAPVLLPIRQQQTGLFTEEERVNAAYVVEARPLPDPFLQREGDDATGATGSATSGEGTPLSNVMLSSAGRCRNPLHGSRRCPE